MDDFLAVCSRIDGMPALWPRGPRWPYDEKVKAKVLEKFNEVPIPQFLLSGIEVQRKTDMTHRHFVHLLELHGASGVKRPGNEWVDLVCAPAGYDGSALINHPPCTAEKFGELYIKHLTLLPGERSGPPPIPLKCDVCGKVCTSECGVCGEIYCSRECMKKDWNNHKDICETIWENGANLAAMMTQMEMQDSLTDADMSMAFGSSPVPSVLPSVAQPITQVQPSEAERQIGCQRKGCANSIATKRCGACTQARYCSKSCQKKDWRTHKPDCLKLRKVA